jgi:drug/metabolite transporter (DMT)-like permease
MGTQRFLYKVSAERKCNTAWTTFSFMGTVTLLSASLFMLIKEPVPDKTHLLLISCLNSSSFVVGTYAHMEALKHVPGRVVYPIIRLNVATVVLFSVVFFGEKPSISQIMGIIVAVCVIFLLARKSEDQTLSETERKRGFVLIFISLLSGSIALISSKLAAIYTSKMGFMAVSYLMGTLFSLALIGKPGRRYENGNCKDALLIGKIMGLVNFVGFYCFLSALTLGPLSIVASVTGMHFIFAIILSCLIYKEKMNLLGGLAIVFTVVAVILLRL